MTENMNKPPTVFHIHSSQDILPLNFENDTLNIYKEKCDLCRTFQASFYCTDCISSGQFASSTNNNSETLIIKKQRLAALRRKRIEIGAICKEKLINRESKDLLPREISECRESIRILKYLIQEKQDLIKTMKKSTEFIKEKNAHRRSKLPRYHERVEKLANYVRDMQRDNQGRKDKLAAKKMELKQTVKSNIADLCRYVFPITRINPTASKSSDEEDSDVINALADASKTSFVRGTWVLMDSSGELQYQIVSPTLPGSGDYSAYLAVQNENGVPITEKIGANEAYNISAALCYTTQLVNLLAFYLDVILPIKVTFNDFCLKELTDRQFSRKVVHLNTNVMYLCFSQGMDSVLLNPKQTLNNILHLVRDADLGQTGPFHVNSRLMLGLECEGAKLRSDEGSEDDDSDHLPWEWEAIPLVACPESVPGSAMSSTQATTSIAGGLVTSLASMFRGWAGNR